MKKRPRIIAGLLFCILVVASVALLWPGEREPEYKGRTLTQWIVLHDRATGAESVHKSAYDPSTLWEADNAVHHIGTNALPWLIKWIQSVPSRSRWRQKTADALDKLPGELWDRKPVDSSLDDPAQTRLGVAGWGFYILGSNANAAVPELTRLANDRTLPQISRNAAMGALTSIGEAGAPILLAILSDRTHPNRSEAAGDIGHARLGTNADFAVHLLAKCVADPDTATAERAAMSLRYVRINPEVSVPALAQGLRRPSDGLRIACAWSLSGYGEQARPALPVLTVMLGDSNWNVRISATNACSKIAPDVLK